jgi:tetratricopeptide (TPR) repeat protein
MMKKRLIPALLAAACFKRGNAYDDKGDYDQAIADYEAALHIDPGHPHAGKNLEAANWPSVGSSDKILSVVYKS